VARSEVGQLGLLGSLKPETQIKRIVLCSSLLQLVTARAAFALRNKTNRGRDNFIDVVVIGHPLLSNEVKIQIRDFATHLGFLEVVDLTQMVRRVGHSSGRWRSLGMMVKNRWGIGVVEELNRRVRDFESVRCEIARKILYGENCQIECYVRLTPKETDSLIFSSLPLGTTFFGLEDGMGNHIEKMWPIKNLNLYEIKYSIRSGISKLVVFLASASLTLSIDSSRKLYFRPTVKFRKIYSNLNYPGSVNTGRAFAARIKDLSKNCEPLLDCRVLILGTKMAGLGKLFSLEDEINFYNKWIECLCCSLEVNRSAIWYRPHPRVEPWMYFEKRERLSCNVTTLERAPMAEIDFCNPSLRAVISVGSTALIHAKTIFDISAFRLPAERLGIHPSTFYKFKTLCEKFEIDEFPIQP
jgi:hypothetical protein